MENKYLKVLTVQYDTEILSHEVALFRGAVINAMKDHANTLFHNHLDDEKYRYSYPLIQYKRIGGKAAIVCVGGGTDVIVQFMAEGASKFRLGERDVEMSVDNMKPRMVEINVGEATESYAIRQWIPLNSENYRKFRQIDGLVGQIEFLERMLTGNILSFAKGVGITVEDEIEVKITSISEPYLKKHKNHSLMTFDADFRSNITLPDHIGLGKNASIGFGMVTRKMGNKEKIA